MAARRRLRRWRSAVLVALLTLTVGAGLATAPAPDASAQPGATTSTLPVDDREFGEIIPKPNSGRAPESPGDPGGWMQVTLFFAICTAIILIAVFVWWRSRQARRRREAEGRDPVSLAKARGEGLRRPPDPQP